MSSSRRSFIKNSSIIVAGATLLPNIYTIATPKEEEKLGIQLYSVDKEMHEDAAGTLKALKKIGYNYVEHADYASRKFYGFSPNDFRKLITDCGLTLLSGHIVLELKHWNKAAKNFTPEWHYAVEDAATAGQQFLITPWLDASLWTNETALKDFMDVFNRSGELCKKLGLQFGYHNHDFEFIHTFNHLRLYDVILQHTDPRLVTQQLDTGNIHQNEFSVSELFAQYPDRFQLLHLKDSVETDTRFRQYKSTPLGEGMMDIEPLIKNAREHGGTYCFIIDGDNDGTNPPYQHLHKNYQAFNNMKNKKIKVPVA